MKYVRNFKVKEKMRQSEFILNIRETTTDKT